MTNLSLTFICRGDETCSSFTQIDQQFFKGAIEGLTFFKVRARIE